MNRRIFLKNASLGAASLAAADPSLLSAAAETKKPAKEGEPPFQYRIAFGARINDLRTDPLPLENWPAPQFDDEAIESAIQAMDVQAAAGFNLLDVWGLFATYGWPPDICARTSWGRCGGEKGTICYAPIFCHW